MRRFVTAEAAAATITGVITTNAHSEGATEDSSSRDWSNGLLYTETIIIIMSGWPVVRGHVAKEISKTEMCTMLFTPRLCGVGHYKSDRAKWANATETRWNGALL